MSARILLGSGILIFASLSCTERTPPEPAAHAPQHVWKEPVKALEAAKNLEKDLQQMHQQRAQQLEERMR